MHDEDRPTRRLNARRSPPDGDTPEANELAQWLRARVGGRSLRQLESLFRNLPGPVPGPGRTQWNELLNGRKLIHPTLLDEVVKKLVPLREQRMHREHGRELLRAAQNAARLASRSSDATSGMPRDYAAHLNDALQGQRRVQATEQGITEFIRVVLLVTTELSQECKDLRDERDRALLQLQEAETTANEHRAAENRKREAENQRHLDDVVERLAESEQQRAKFEEMLNCAIRKKQEAEDLRSEASRQLAREDASQSPGGADPVFLPAPRPPEYKHFLEIADAQLDVYTAELDAAREQIAGSLPPAAQGARIIPGEVVSDPSADSADTTPPAGGDPAHGVSADRPDNGPGGVVETPVAMPGSDNPQDRGAAPPTNGAGANTAAGRSGRKGKGSRVALIGAACLALLAGGGWLTWEHYQPEYVPSDSKALRVAKARGFLRIGVKENQPGLSEQMDKNDPLSWEGFDIEFAKNIAKALGFTDEEEEITFVATATADREKDLREHKIDLFVGSYSITDKRKDEGVAFAGPYLSTDQGVLVYTANGSTEETYVYDEKEGELVERSIHSVNDFENGTKVCTVKGSISKDILTRTAKNLVIDATDVDYRPCVKKLEEGVTREDPVAVITDVPILLGFAAGHENLKVIRDQVDGTTTHWGVGMAKDDPALKDLVCESIAEQINSGTWDELKDELMEYFDKKSNGKKSREFYIEAPREEEDRTEC
ncbi:transporter substrate-binding domain-containing protein [Streptomyces sp. SAI-229]|uniref:transporter substrate-binding domain-containing protein n=1 Tax=Streptomyces sp. SAI-229 TaxID=3377731 RepID=UPI003C7D748F